MYNMYDNERLTLVIHRTNMPLKVASKGHYYNDLVTIIKQIVTIY